MGLGIGAAWKPARIQAGGRPCFHHIENHNEEGRCLRKRTHTDNLVDACTQ